MLNNGSWLIEAFVPILFEAQNLHCIPLWYMLVVHGTIFCLAKALHSFVDLIFVKLMKRVEKIFEN